MNKYNHIEVGDKVYVKVVDTNSMSHFTTKATGVVDHLGGGGADDQECGVVFCRSKGTDSNGDVSYSYGSSSWYGIEDLTLIERNRADLIKKYTDSSRRTYTREIRRIHGGIYFEGNNNDK